MRKKRIAALSNYFGVDLRNEEVMHWLGMMRGEENKKGETFEINEYSPCGLRTELNILE